MRLNDIAKLLVTSRLVGDGETEITGIGNDSRTIEAGHLFICLRGHKVDGHRFAREAAEAGAAAIVAERELESDVPQLIVRDSRLAMAVIANHFYHYPSRDVKLIGVTGTNG